MPNTPIQATAEGMPAPSRRRFLQMLPAAIAAVPSPAPAAPIEPMEAARYHADQLAAAMNAINSERMFRVAFDTESTFVLICGDRKDGSDRVTPAAYDGPNFYEIELTNGTRPIWWLERVEYRTTPGHYYVAESRWKGRLESKPQRLKEKHFRIVRKVEDYGGRVI
ncbi:hypothetical protein SAMN02927900_01275 [Rhizobium mongolense subsp. loessense]|uniref:Uncharacterized protein n=1 Tax=Rhizobium mongolense subsp. loessense TaxID=158890 RepID=A0A1G4Q3F9_9HYPH|nr:hypothetical protein [Rhizobium mongolense]SCW38878.1 hypothetical protein SAMN02927900_01275 [Rhizobium mongolense subsp. loessense]